MLFTFQHSSVSKTLLMIKIIIYTSFIEFGACVETEIALHMPVYMERRGWHLMLLLQKKKNPLGTVLIYRTCWEKKEKNAVNVKQSVTHGSLPHVFVSPRKHDVPQNAVLFCCFGPLQALVLKHCRGQQLQTVRIQDLGLQKGTLGLDLSFHHGGSPRMLCCMEMQSHANDKAQWLWLWKRSNHWDHTSFGCSIVISF